MLVSIGNLYTERVPSLQRKPRGHLSHAGHRIAGADGKRSIMRAIVQTTFGGPEVLQLAEVDKPKPLPSEVLVRVHATGINPVDTFVRSGAFPRGQGGGLG